jgi:CBS domain containing-hemolysin-like protein
LKSCLPIINFIFYFLYPVVTFLIRFSDFVVAKFIGAEIADSGTEWVSSEQEVQFLIRYTSEKGLIESEKTEMLQSIFDLGVTPVKEIMVPATDIISVNANTSTNAILDIYLQHHFTRLPVYEGKTDNIIGMVHLKDIFALITRGKDRPLKEMIRPIIFVPESVKVNQLLREFRQQHMHIAMVLDEHGSVIGLITLEDILEEIVGEISDEHDFATEKIVALKSGGWLVNAGISLENLQETLEIEFETEDSVTLGGFLSEQLQHLPRNGERLSYKGFSFQIQKANRKRVLQVLVFKETQPH